MALTPETQQAGGGFIVTPREGARERQRERDREREREREREKERERERERERQRETERERYEGNASRWRIKVLLWSHSPIYQ